jgi:hypothetical protein
MKTSAPRRSGDEDLYVKKTRRRRLTHQECLGDKYLHAEKIPEAKASETKTYASRRS